MKGLCYEVMICLMGTKARCKVWPRTVSLLFMNSCLQVEAMSQMSLCFSSYVDSDLLSVVVTCVPTF